MKRQLFLAFGIGLLSAASPVQVQAQPVPDLGGTTPPPPPLAGIAPGAPPPPPVSGLAPLPPPVGAVPPGSLGPSVPFGIATILSGRVKSYLINPSGQLDGLLLNDGKQLHLPPHLSANLARAVKPGENIQATVEPGVPSQFGQEYRTITLSNAQSGATVVDQPPLTPPPPPAPGQQINARGTLTKFLVGHMGELNGFILSDGTQVHFPPPQGASVSQQIRVGDRIAVEGYGARSAAGTSLDMTGLSINGQSLPVYGGPRP